jgi:hypothetical protein
MEGNSLSIYENLDVLFWRGKAHSMNSSPNALNAFPLGRIVMLAMDEILGHNEVTTVLDLSNRPDSIEKNPGYTPGLKFSFEYAGRLQAVLESAFGPRAGRGLSLRVGRACFKYSLREYGSELGLTGLAFRLLPLSSRLKVGSVALASCFKQFTDQRVRLEMDEKHFHWQIDGCLLCSERHADGPCCALAVGFLQESLYWMSGGKYFLVEDKKYVAPGECKCAIKVDQTPIC